MNLQQLKDRLLTDPHFIFQYIYANNPDQVILNLRALGERISNEDDVMRVVGDLLESGNEAILIEAFSVPFLTDQIDPAEVALIPEVAVALNTVAGGPARKVDISAVLGALATGAVAYMGMTGQTKPQGAAATATAPTPPKKDNTLQIVLIGAGVLAAIVVIIVALKKK